MVKAEDSWPFQQHSAYYLPESKYMSNLLHPGRPNLLSSPANHRTSIPSNVAFPGFVIPESNGFRIDHANGARGLFHFLPPHLENFPSAINPHLRGENAFYQGQGINTTSNAAPGPSQKSFVVFDQFGTDTKMFFGSICTPPTTWFPIIPPAKFVHAGGLFGKTQSARMDQEIPSNPTIRENSDENEITGKQSEMHEDTEEINALLYSSDDECDDGDEDEVTSTGHSPFPTASGCKKRGYSEKISTETASSDCKRLRLLDGSYKKSSLMDVAWSTELERFYEYENDAESSYANEQSQGEDMGSILGIQWSKKDNIRETLKILESMIPGMKSRDPLFIIEEAISYLKYLKTEAQALGVSELP